MVKADKTCPKCDSRDYRFRARKTVTADKDRPSGTETKYQCSACQHTWKVMTPAQSR
jgi:DNA-directed RNA polymerase subunit M/transcription elongation factor TFIIS